MCPVFEQQEREFKKNVHPLEQVGPGDAVFCQEGELISILMDSCVCEEGRTTGEDRPVQGGHDVSSIGSGDRSAITFRRTGSGYIKGAPS